MKKLFSYILLLAMVLGLFAGCETEKPDLTGLDKAKTYLYNLYKDAGENTVANFEVVGVVVVQGYGTYNITWTATSDAITFTPNGKMVTVNIPVSPAEEIVYNLVATLDDGKGNTAKVEFKHKVPAGGNLTDGTYVILNGNLTMSSLVQDKSYGYPTANEVTVTNGVVSNHFKADVLTFTKVGDYYTIQDAYGRYFYLKGTYNSFNVDATMPAEGHLFNIGKDGDFFTITNILNQKTLAYSTSYTSWGCYAELGEDHASKLYILPATAPSTDPEVPTEPSTPTTPSTTTKPTTPSTGNTGDNKPVTSPVAGTPYKMALIQATLGKTLYFSGVEKTNYPWYINGVENKADAVDVYVENVTGGLRLYFMVGSTKTYLDMYKDGTHYSLKLTTTPTTVYTWNTQYNTLVAMNEDKECFVGTSSNYNTFSCNQLDKVSTSFVAHLYSTSVTAPEESTAGSTTPTTPSTPSTPSATLPPVTAPVVGTTYKFGMIQVTTGNTVFIDGGVSNSRFLTTTTDKNASLDVTVEASGSGYKFAVTISGAKQYITMTLNSESKAALSYTAEGTVFTFDSATSAWLADLNGTKYYIGSYSTFDTMSGSKSSYITSDNTGVSQFPAGLFTK